MYDKTVQKVLCKSKSEKTFEITDFCALKPRCYAHKVFTGKNLKNTRRQKECWETKKRYALWKIRKDTEWKYKKTLNNAITSKNHQFYCNNKTKIALTSFCKMRYWADAIYSVPFGHFSISIWFIIIKILMIITFFNVYCPCTFWFWNACLSLTYR